MEPSGPENPVLTGSVRRQGYIINKFFIKGEGDYPVPYLLMIPEKSNGKVIIYLHPEGKSAEATRQGEMESFVRKGFILLAPDMIGTGEVGPGDWQGGSYFRHAYNKNLNHQIWYASILTGKSIVGIRASDVNRLVKVVIETINLEFIDNTVAGALCHYDLPDLAASLAPRNLLMANITDGRSIRSESELIMQDISIIRRTYFSKKAENNLHILNGEIAEQLERFFQQK